MALGLSPLLPHFSPGSLPPWAFPGLGCVFPKPVVGACFPGLIFVGPGYLSHPLRRLPVLLASLQSLQGCHSWSNIMDLQTTEDPMLSHPSPLPFSPESLTYSVRCSYVPSTVQGAVRCLLTVCLAQSEHLGVSGDGNSLPPRVSQSLLKSPRF